MLAHGRVVHTDVPAALVYLCSSFRCITTPKGLDLVQPPILGHRYWDRGRPAHLKRHVPSSLG